MPDYALDEPVLEGYTTLGYLAAHTERVRLGLLVTGVTYRHPGLLAKIVATLDVLSRGRADLGIGAAWFEREHLALGVPFPPLRERFERLEEAIAICLQMWSPDNGPFDGRHYHLAETLCVPAPLQSPHPPVLIGGAGEQKTLRLVARFADTWDVTVRSLEREGPALEVLDHKLEVLRGHCAETGRPFDDIGLTISYAGDSLSNDRDAFLAEMEGFAKRGVGRVIAVATDTDDLAAWITSACGPLVDPLAAM